MKWTPAANFSPYSRDEYQAYLKSPLWRAKRASRQALDGECRTCGATTLLEVHHVRYPEVIGGEAPTDLITLCKPCHDAIHLSLARRTCDDGSS